MDSDTDDFFASPRSKNTKSTVSHNDALSVKGDKAEFENFNKRDESLNDKDGNCTSYSSDKNSSSDSSDSEMSDCTKNDLKSKSYSSEKNSDSDDYKMENKNKKPKTNLKISDSNTDSDSDVSDNSDVTEVSPLHTPRAVSASSSNHQESVRYEENSQKSSKPPNGSLSKRSRPTSASSANHELSPTLQQYINSNKKSLNLRLLEQAIIELDNDKGTKIETASSSSDNISSNCNLNGQKNYTFSNLKARDIDVENQRLMHKIVQHAKEAKELKKKPNFIVQQKPIYHSAVRRKKDHQRIEEENLAFVKRLKAIKPCKELRRDVLLRDYGNKTIFGCSVADAHEPLRVKSRSSNSTSSTDRSSSRTFSSLYSYGSSATKSASSLSLKSDSSTFVDDEFDTQFVSEALARTVAKSRPQSAHTKFSVPESNKNRRERPRSAYVSSAKTVTQNDLQSSHNRVTWEEGW